jgi:hypothetical protein
LKYSRPNVADAFAKQGIDPQQWFAIRIAKLQGEKATDEREVEAIELLPSAIVSANARELDLSR